MFYFLFLFFLKFYLFIFNIYFWLCWVLVSVRGLSPVAASGGHSSPRCAGLFTIAASLVAEHRLQTRRLSSCGSWAQLLRGMRDPPRPGLEPVSPALAGRLSTTAPPGKPLVLFLITVLLGYVPYMSPIKTVQLGGFHCIHRIMQSSPQSILEHFHYLRKKPHTV